VLVRPFTEHSLHFGQIIIESSGTLWQLLLAFDFCLYRGVPHSPVCILLKGRYCGPGFCPLTLRADWCTIGSYERLLGDAQRLGGVNIYVTA